LNSDDYKQNPNDLNHGGISASRIRFHKKENLKLNTKHPIVKILVGHHDKQEEE
jgi:hypothetical protein